MSVASTRVPQPILELFNLFNRANYGSYTTNIDSAAYGQPVFNSPFWRALRAHQRRLRAAQLGFRLLF
jgi:hypothetical protein